MNKQSPELRQAVERVTSAIETCLEEFGVWAANLKTRNVAPAPSDRGRIMTALDAALRLVKAEGAAEEAGRNECEGWRQAKAGDILRRCGRCVYDLRLRIVSSELAAARAACEAQDE